MASIIPNEGERALSEMALNRAEVGPIKFRLFSGFTGGGAMDADLTLANLTQLSGDGYVEETAMPGTWTYTTDVEGHTRATYGTEPVTWTFSASKSVYGYYVVWDKGGTGSNEQLIWAAQVPNPPLSTEAFSVLISFDLNQTSGA
jgi:hypothetical protein